jgi:DNA repair exonuclease SbcCD ATPase subunit
MDMMETVFQPTETCSREEMFRQWIYLDRMETKMKTMDHNIQSLMTTVQKLTQEKVETRDAFYDCQAELFQQKEFVAILERDEAVREGKRLQHIRKIEEYIQHTEDDLEGIERTLNSLRQSPYSVVESVNSLKERKGILLKQKQSYQELLGFIV